MEDGLTQKKREDYTEFLRHCVQEQENALDRLYLEINLSCGLFQRLTKKGVFKNFVVIAETCQVIEVEAGIVRLHDNFRIFLKERYAKLQDMICTASGNYSNNEMR